MNEKRNTYRLPKDWKLVTLADISEKISNGANAKQFDQKIGYPISRIETIWNETIDLNRVKYISENDPQFIEKYSLKKGDILFSHINSDIHLGKTAIFKNQTDILIHGTNLLLIRLKENISSDFLNYQFKYKRKKGEFISIAQKSVNQSSINQQKLKSLSFILPPFQSQLEIASKIEELFSELDKGIEQLKTAQQQLKTYRQAILKWAFEGKLTNGNVKDGELPQGWELQHIGKYILKIEAGKSFKCEERTPLPGEIGVLKVSAVTWGEFDENESKTVLDNSKINEAYFVNKGDFLLSRANTIELVGNCVIVKSVKKEVMLSDKTLRISFNSSLEKEYCLYFLRSRKGRQQIESLSTGNQESMRNIGQERIKQILIPYCPVKEQQSIVNEIESRLSAADKMEESIKQSLLQSESLRQSILKMAFEGRLLTSDTIEVVTETIKAAPQDTVAIYNNEKIRLA